MPEAPEPPESELEISCSCGKGGRGGMRVTHRPSGLSVYRAWRDHDGSVRRLRDELVAELRRKLSDDVGEVSHPPRSA